MWYTGETSSYNILRKRRHSQVCSLPGNLCPRNGGAPCICKWYKLKMSLDAALASEFEPGIAKPGGALGCRGIPCGRNPGVVLTNPGGWCGWFCRLRNGWLECCCKSPNPSGCKDSPVLANSSWWWGCNPLKPCSPGKTGWNPFKGLLGDSPRSLFLNWSNLA